MFLLGFCRSLNSYVFFFEVLVQDLAYSFHFIFFVLVLVVYDWLDSSASRARIFVDDFQLILV